MLHEHGIEYTIVLTFKPLWTVSSKNSGATSVTIALQKAQLRFLLHSLFSM